MRIINKKDDKVMFIAEIEDSLANAIRRYLDQIPILAIEEVEISKNDSPLYDETVAHRMGLIPLKMQKTSDESEKLILKAKKEGAVYSEELKGNLSPVYGKIPITVLEKGQELELSATLKAGKGKDHSKFSPGLLYYREIFDVKVEKDCPEEIIKVCPQKILSLEGGKVTVTDNEKCDMCEACIEECKKQGKDSIKIIPTKELLITLESFGQISTSEMLKRSIDALKKDLAIVEKKLK